MNKSPDITGMTSGRLRAIKPTDTTSKHGYKYCLCMCACGKIIETRAINIRSRASKSCGCLKGRRANSIGIYSRAIAQQFWQQCIESTGEFADSVSADELTFMVCEYAAVEGYELSNFPTWDDLLQTMPSDTHRTNRTLHDGAIPDSGDIYGIIWK